MDQQLSTDQERLEKHISGAGNIEINQLSPALGAEIVGLDVSQPVSQATKALLLDAIRVYKLLVVRRQSLDAARQEAFTGYFGEIIREHVGKLADGSPLPAVFEISNLDQYGNLRTRPHLYATEHWHTDGAHLSVPPSFTILHAVDLPPTGGDTEFANMELAYEALPPESQRTLDGLKAVHSYYEKNLNTGGQAATPTQLKETPPVVHPLIRSNPETGAKSLYIGMYAVRILGMRDDEALALLQGLMKHATQPQFVFSQRWQPGDLVIWDNRSLMHRAMGNYDGSKYKRVLRRSVVKGVEPI